MQELIHILINKFTQLSEQIASHDLPYDDNYKTKILYKIDGIMHDTCMARGYTYDVLKCNTDTVLLRSKIRCTAWL